MRWLGHRTPNRDTTENGVARMEIGQMPEPLVAKDTCGVSETLQRGTSVPMSKFGGVLGPGSCKCLKFRPLSGSDHYAKGVKKVAQWYPSWRSGRLEKFQSHSPRSVEFRREPLSRERRQALFALAVEATAAGCSTGTLAKNAWSSSRLAPVTRQQSAMLKVGQCQLPTKKSRKSRTPMKIMRS